VVGPLFDDRPEFDREKLKTELSRLAAEGIYIGGSSWKYEGWIGQVYRRENYLQHGRFSHKLFETACIKEYAETFPTVCGDFAFYQFPEPEFWQRLFQQVPDSFRFAFKVPEQITCKVFPSHPRYGNMAGRENESFLDLELFQNMFLDALLPFRAQTALLIFEFGTFSSKAFSSAGELAERLHPFLAQLPQEFRYAVEIRNPEFLEREYFQCLRDHGVAHVYNAWSRMPELKEQIAIPDSVTADFLVCRALLRRARAYEDAVAMFQPYTHIQDPNPEVRESMRVIVQRAREKNHVAFLFVNNRLEGNAPATIVSLVETPPSI
jgi:uncharacterized protein YecE (DUF72 family)